MADVWYDKGLTQFLQAGINLLTANIKFAAVTSGYTFSQSHEFVTDLGANIVGRTGNLASKTAGSVAQGVFDAADATFTALTGSVVTQLVMFKDSGSDASSPLILIADSSNYTGLPFTPTGADVPLIFPAAGIGKI